MPLIQNPLTYAVIVPLGDDNDFSKRMNVGKVGTTAYVIWNAATVAGGTSSTPLDLTDTDALGVYIQVSGPTTISLEVQTAQSEDGSGWSVLDTTVFTNAMGDYIFYNIWLLPFQVIRFNTSETVMITIECFKRM